MEYETALASKCQTEEEVTVHAGEQPIGDLSSGRSKPAPGRHGVLRYKRETTIPSIPCSLSSQPPQPPVVCEACGEEAQPPLDLLGLERPQLFCCSQHQQLWEWLSHERLPALKTAAQETTPPPDSQPTKEKEAELQAQERDKHRKLEAERKLLCQDNSLLPVDTCTPHSRTISYLLSRSVPISDPRSDPRCVPISDPRCVPRSVPRCVPRCVPRSVPRCAPVPGQDLDLEPGLDMDPGPGPGLDQQDSQFGLSYPGGLQVGTAVVQRSYPSGGVFLTAFPDGSAQIFYPSGLLALILLVDGERRVCLVYDDHIPNQQPIRAVFHSDGRATCYHSNGSVWLSIGMSGGECVSETGSRVRQWSWGSLGPPASMRPLFLSLNPSLGLRVLGNMQICLRFLSRGCQARVRLGGQPRGAGPPHDPPTSREELLLLAGRVGVHLGLRRLRWCLQTPSSPHPCQAPHLGPLAHRLLERSCTLAHRDRAFIHTCLQDLL